MEHKSLHLLIPNQRPFDQENWFESFVGNFVLPILDTGKASQYWFSRYGAPGRREICFRFSLASYDDLRPLVESLLSTYSFTDLRDEEEYDWVADLGSARFLEDNQRHQDRQERAQLVLDYLHSVASLFVHCLSHSDEHGYWYQELNNDFNNPHGSVFESLHHLFCNMAEAKTLVVEYELDGEQGFTSELYFTHLAKSARDHGRNLVLNRKIAVMF